MRHSLTNHGAQIAGFAIVFYFALSPAVGSSITVTHRARTLAQGEVVELTVRGPGPLSAVEARAFDKLFRFYSTRDPRLWKGLVGIDLETRPGSYAIDVRATLGGRRTAGKHVLAVKAKSFPTRRLTMDEKFVTPPPEVQARIASEAERLAAVFASESEARGWEGAFRAPVDAPPISSFGKRSILNGKPRSPHAGTDFGSPPGAEVRAPGGGRVVLADDLYFSGNTVIVDHGLGLFSLFAHLSKIDVEKGTLLRTGRIVGRVGSTGRSTGPHLHWSVRLAGARVDPLSLIAATSPSPAGKPPKK